MRSWPLILAAIFVAALRSPLALQQKGGEEETGPYDIVEKWPTPWAPTGYIWGSQPGVFAETPNRIFIAARGELKLPEKLGWPGFRQANDILISADQHVWVADGTNSKVLEYDQNGKLLYSWGTYGTFPGQFWELHQMSVDSEGNFYGADSFGGRTQKFRPKPGADRAKLIGPPAPLK